MREDGSRLTPIRYRERVRAAGPSILADVPGYVAPAAAHSPAPESALEEAA